MTSSFQPKFVEFIPKEIEPGVLYVSLEYATASHLCACGCGRRVVTPLSPVRWQMIFDGETVTLEPSIGNWEFPCRSHYWVTRNNVEWAESWDQKRIREVRERQREAVREHRSEIAASPLGRLFKRLRGKRK